MATYMELRNLFGNDSLRNRVEVALCMKVHAILQEATPSGERLAWARGVLSNSYSEANSLLKYALAANAGLTLAQLLEASDEALLAAVGAAVDKLYP